MSKVIGDLSRALSYRIITEEQQHAWSITAQAVHSWTQMASDTPDEWLVLMEYAPPLLTRRSDVIIITSTSALVMEFKTGLTSFSSAKQQALDYALDIYWYHPGAQNRNIVPIVVQKSGKDKHIPSLPRDQVPSHVFSASSELISRILNELATTEHGQPICVNEDLWFHTKYTPRPSIVDAAVALLAKTEDSGIITALSDDMELDRLTDQLIDQVRRAESLRQHRLVLVTGVPGAGKTLVGLRLAHDESIIQRLRELGQQPPLYLTGNGTLVKVLTAALAQNHKSRHPEMNANESRRKAETLVKLVHAFSRDALASADQLQIPHVTIFDEGQRAWDQKRMGQEHKVHPDLAESEPEVILRSLEKQDWAVLVVLVGVGQEINRGEPGARVWVEGAKKRAVSAARVRWHVSGPPALVSASDAHTTSAEGLHLQTTRRSVGAVWLADWVEFVLSNDPRAAAALCNNSSYPIWLTRDLGEAKKKLAAPGKHHRYGLLASAKSGRLRPYGLEMEANFQASVDWAKWFLDRPPSLSSSTALEIAASEFKIQGLEIDIAGLCWSWDLVRGRDTWETQRLDLPRLVWCPTFDEKRRFTLNTYRVLLTRARQALVIWVPQGSSTDNTRNGTQMDEVAAYLTRCGARSITR